MPATSAPQQHLMGMALAYKRGDIHNAGPEVRKVAAGMTQKQLHDFAATRGLPQHADTGGGISGQFGSSIGSATPSSQAVDTLRQMQQMSPEQLRAAAASNTPTGAMAKQMLRDNPSATGSSPSLPATMGAPHYARGGGLGSIHGGMHLAGNIVPKGHLVPGFSGSTFKPPKPEGATPSTWSERTEARQMDRPMGGGGFAAGGGIGATHLQDGGLGEMSPWFEHQESSNEISMPQGGFLNSSIAGRTDRLPLAVAADSHVLPADVVSGLGQGNSLSGQRVMQEALRIGPYGDQHPQVVHGRGPPRAPGIPGEVEREMFGYAKGGRAPEKGISHTLMAGGEFIVPRDDWTDGKSVYRGVKSIGEGDIEKGHARLRDLTRRVREHTIRFLNTAPPPKR